MRCTVSVHLLVVLASCKLQVAYPPVTANRIIEDRHRRCGLSSTQTCSHAERAATPRATHDASKRRYRDDTTTPAPARHTQRQTQHTHTACDPTGTRSTHRYRVSRSSCGLRSGVCSASSLCFWPGRQPPGHWRSASGGGTHTHDSMHKAQSRESWRFVTPTPLSTACDSTQSTVTRSSREKRDEDDHVSQIPAPWPSAIPPPDPLATRHCAH